MSEELYFELAKVLDTLPKWFSGNRIRCRNQAFEENFQTGRY